MKIIHCDSSTVLAVDKFSICPFWHSDDIWRRLSDLVSWKKIQQMVSTVTNCTPYIGVIDSTLVNITSDQCRWGHFNICRCQHALICNELLWVLSILQKGHWQKSSALTLVTHTHSLRFFSLNNKAFTGQ